MNKRVQMNIDGDTYRRLVKFSDSLVPKEHKAVLSSPSMAKTLNILLDIAQKKSR